MKSIVNGLVFALAGLAAVQALPNEAFRREDSATLTTSITTSSSSTSETNTATLSDQTSSSITETPATSTSTSTNTDSTSTPVPTSSGAVTTVTACVTKALDTSAMLTATDAPCWRQESAAGAISYCNRPDTDFFEVRKLTKDTNGDKDLSISSQLQWGNTLRFPNTWASTCSLALVSELERLNPLGQRYLSGKFPKDYFTTLLFGGPNSCALQIMATGDKAEDGFQVGDTDVQFLLKHGLAFSVDTGGMFMPFGTMNCAKLGVETLNNMTNPDNMPAINWRIVPVDGNNQTMTTQFAGPEDKQKRWWWEH